MIRRSHLVASLVLLVAACTSIPASDRQPSSKEIPAEVYIAVLDAAAGMLAPQVDGPLYVEMERIPAHVSPDRVREAGFELRSACDPGGRHFAPGQPVTPEPGVWVVDAVYSSRGGGTGHEDIFIVRCDDGSCRATGGHGIGALVAIQEGCDGGEAASLPRSADAACGGITGVVRIADNPGGLLAGAQVVLAGTQAGAITDRDGRFVIRPGGVPGAAHQGELRVVRLGYRPVTVPLTLHPDSATVVRVAMPKSMPRPEWQREPEVEVEVRSCRAV
jgi:hypothetical protein